MGPIYRTPPFHEGVALVSSNRLRKGPPHPLSFVSLNSYLPAILPWLV